MVNNSSRRSSAIRSMKQNVLRLRLRPLLSALVLGATYSSHSAESAAPVTLRESDRTFFLDNGILSVRIEKDTGEIFSIKYQGQEMLAQDSSGGALGGYWSSVGRARGGSQQSAVVRINPEDNHGERGEVSCNFHNAPGTTNSPLDVDVRYSLGRGESWIYTYLVWSHKPGYPGFGVGEARYAVKLNPAVFDYMTIDKDRRRQMPSPADWDAGAALNLKEARRMTTGIHKGQAEHKYDYSALIYEIPAYGWSSTKYNLGFWFINPSFEYMAGGPTKAELTGHLDVNPGGTPTLLNMWLGSHYGGSSLAVGENENWTKVVGPFAIYCNTASTHEAMWRDALDRARTEAGTWPYSWVADPNYPQEAQRSTVHGQIVLRDPFDPALKVSNIWVGLTAPNYVPPRVNAGNFGRRNNTNAPTGSGPNFPAAFGTNGFRGGFPAEVDWQRDARNYQFWIPASANGKFTLPNVRPGQYTLRAIGDGVIGEFAVPNLIIGAGETKSLGTLTWQPQRYGRTLWQIGVPDRTAREFRHGDHYWQWGLYFSYAKEFPNDVNYIVGRSDWSKDWNYVQPPRILTQNLSVVGEDDDAADQMAQFVRTAGREVQPSTWAIKFGLSQAPRGQATLRLAFCGTHAGCNVEVFVNDKSIGDTGPLPSTSAMQRDGIRAFWIEKPLSFDAGLLQGGVNTLKLKSHANTWSQGVMYDVVRLELNEPPP
jgi:rhamnogalacturonan endolyase